MRMYFCVPGKHDTGDKNIYTRIHLHDGSSVDLYFGADMPLTRAVMLVPELLKKRLGNRWRRHVATEIIEVKYTKRGALNGEDTNHSS